MSIFKTATTVSLVQTVPKADETQAWMVELEGILK